MGVVRTALASRAVGSVTSPHHVDHYLEKLHPLWTAEAVRARVVGIERETDNATTVTLRPNGAWKGFTPGQHVEFGVEVDGVRKVRVFSVSSSAAAKGRNFSVSVKAHPDGFVSRFLNSRLASGELVYLSQAQGDFVLPAGLPDELLLLSGGSGITPVMSMLRTLLDSDAIRPRRITFLHYARSREDEMFTEQLDGWDDLPDVDVVRVYTREPEQGAELTGRFSVDHLKHLGIDPATTLTYVCGPAGLIASVRDAYSEQDAADQVRFEYFKVPTIDPALLEAAAAAASGTLTFDRSGSEATNSGNTILEQAEAAGLTPEYGCRMGVCNTCAIKKLHGAVRHVISGEINANTDETIKPCVHVPVGDVAVAL
ncbi:ferredoxin reductase [Aeromicrobium sp. Leaf350]|uniref:ferredoxin reductase n=1 Tax=Aeromicrobium sp. Leaf350 TaxID=2876565 RepID=UPI001E3BCE8D|nr:ferredoxin reductase [Aeromicrobium sp. Leaf350]